MAQFTINAARADNGKIQVRVEKESLYCGKPISATLVGSEFVENEAGALSAIAQLERAMRQRKLQCVIVGGAARLIAGQSLEAAE